MKVFYCDKCGKEIKGTSSNIMNIMTLLTATETFKFDYCKPCLICAVKNAKDFAEAKNK